MSKETIELPKTLEEAMELATRVLEKKNSNFQNTRKIIKSTFTNPDKTLSLEENIKIRLLILDANYSTQMGRCLYGIQDLAKKISDICKLELKKSKSEIDITNIDECFNNLIIQYVNNCKSGNIPENDPIQNLFDSKYGIYKTGQDKVKDRRSDSYGIKSAVSLISKYCNYVSNYKFPIDDSLVRKNTNDILYIFRQQFDDYQNIIIKRNTNNLIKDLVQICKGNNRHFSFDKFDHLVWAYGKITKGSLSLFVTKNNYLDITKEFDILNLINTSKVQKKKIKEEDPDLKVTVETAENIIMTKLADKKILKSLYSKKLISSDLYKFILFCFDCKSKQPQSS